MARYRKDKTKAEREETSAIVNQLNAINEDLPEFNSLEVLPGMKDARDSERLRDIVARQFAGYSDTQIQKDLGKAVGYINNMERYHPRAFELARAEHAARVVSRYVQNMKVVTAALSDAGFLAIKTLKDVMSDPEASASVRRHAAVDILNLLSVGQAGKKKVDTVNQSVVVEIMGALKGSDERATYVVTPEEEIEDAEVVE